MYTPVHSKFAIYEIVGSNIHYFYIASLSFKTRMKISVCIVAKPHAIFQSFLLKMFGLSLSFMSGNFTPKLCYNDIYCPNGILHVLSQTKLLPVSIYENKL